MGTAILLLLLAGLLGGSSSPPPVILKKKKAAGEPDYQPGPVDLHKKKLDENEDAEDTWLPAVDALISLTPRAGAFYLIRAGDTASAIAGAALGGSKNTGSNRLNLIKCMSRVGWNEDLYLSDRHPGSWGELYDVDGRNLSAAFLPRHASATQHLAMRSLPPRTISGSGAHTGGDETGYFGLLWIPNFSANANAVSCSTVGPPDWLVSELS